MAARPTVTNRRQRPAAPWPPASFAGMAVDRFAALAAPPAGGARRASRRA